MREAALCDRHAKAYEEPDTQRTFFSEIISSISDVRFSRCGRVVSGRDKVAGAVCRAHSHLCSSRELTPPLTPSAPCSWSPATT